jgi:DNA-directed RNA polymerase subunit M/transcription elongation factor TFIIS
MTWDMPSDKICPKCSSFLTQKVKGSTITYKCADPDCDYIEEQQKESKSKATTRKMK